MQGQPQNNKPLPVIIISGFLGSGKTTLLRRILADETRAKRIAVVENELGQMPIDGETVSEMAPARLETVIGRTCCQTRDSFVNLLREISADAQKYDYLVIESTGVAHPGMMANAILSAPDLRQSMRVDGIITVVDAANFAAHLGGDGHAREQVAYADCVIVNKADLSTPAKTAALLAQLREINPSAQFEVVSRAQTSIDCLRDFGGFTADKIAKSAKDCLEACQLRNGRAHEIDTVALSFEEPFAFLSLKEWLEDFIARNRDNLYRAKGIISLANVGHRVLMQGVHDNFYMDIAGEWGGAPRVSHIVFIGKNLDAARIETEMRKCIF